MFFEIIYIIYIIVIYHQCIVSYLRFLHNFDWCNSHCFTEIKSKRVDNASVPEFKDEGVNQRRKILYTYAKIYFLSK